MKGVELTGIVTLFYSQYCFDNHVLPGVNDPLRKSLVEHFSARFLREGVNPHQLMTLEQVPFQGILNVAARSALIDRLTQQYACGREIVNIGCGFDTRYFRIGNSAARYIDVDLPVVIREKRRLLPQTEAYEMVETQSAFASSFWTSGIHLRRDDPVVIAEGVFCYITYEKVLHFVRSLFERYPRATLICDVFLYEPHLVFDDAKSKAMLRDPETGLQHYEQHRNWYAVQGTLKKLLCCKKKKPFPECREWLALKEFCTNDGRETGYPFHNVQYQPEYWIGIYEKKERSS